MKGLPDKVKVRHEQSLQGMGRRGVTAAVMAGVVSVVGSVVMIDPKDNTARNATQPN